MQPNQVPGIMRLLQQIWFSMALLLLLGFLFKVTGLTLLYYGALPAAIMFGTVTLMVLYSIWFATARATA